MKKRVWLASPTTHDEEMQFVREAFATNWVAPLGPNVDAFEAETASRVGVRAAAACVSGTSALFLAYKLAGLRPGDSAFCSDATFAATANPICYLGARPIFIDSERETWNMCPEALETAFRKYPNVRVVALTHLYGTPAKTDEIVDICDRFGATLVEDAAEAFGAVGVGGRRCGAIGKYAVLSFNGNKIITTSGGGMLLSDDEKAIARAKFWSTQARDPAPWYQHSEIGYNFRMSNVVAGIGRGQLLHLDEHCALKERIYRRYRAEFAGLPVATNPYLPDTTPNFWLSCLLIDRGVDVAPSEIARRLADENIESRPIWKPMSMQPVFAESPFVGAGVGRDLFARGLCLPSDIKMTPEEQTRVVETVKRCFSEPKRGGATAKNVEGDVAK